MTTATMLERGQITIPKQFRDALGFMPGMVFEFKVDGVDLKISAAKKCRAEQRIKALNEAYGCLKGVFGDMTSDEIVAEMRGR